MSDPVKNMSTMSISSSRGEDRSLFEKWDERIVKQINGGPSVLYIDKHFIHEVTSPQAFQGLEKRGLKVFRPQQVLATAEHNVPTRNQHLPIKDELSRNQVQNNVLDNFLLPVQVSEAFLQQTFAAVKVYMNTELEVNLKQQTIRACVAT